MTQPYEIAAGLLGKGEVPDRATIQEFLKNGGQNLDPVTTAWCAAFVNASLAGAGQQGTGKLNARSFLEWGVGVDQPQKGDVAVLSRGDPNGWTGHVGFFDSMNPDGTINILGGNQGDAVSIKPFDASKVLGYRRAAEGGAQPAQPSPMTPPVQQTNAQPAQQNVNPAMQPTQQAQPAMPNQPKKDNFGEIMQMLSQQSAPQMGAQQAGPQISQGSGDPLGATMAAIQSANKAKGLTGLPDIDSLMALGKRPMAAM